MPRGVYNPETTVNGKIATFVLGVAVGSALTQLVLKRLYAFRVRLGLRT